MSSDLLAGVPSANADETLGSVECLQKNPPTAEEITPRI